MIAPCLLLHVTLDTGNASLPCRFAIDQYERIRNMKRIFLLDSDETIRP